MRLDTVVERIEAGFGDSPPFTSGSLDEADRAVLSRVFGDEGYQVYLQDQINRQIIRDYLTNAVMRGFIAEDALAEFGPMIASADARAALSLHMLMASLEQAPELLASGVPSQLQRLEPGADSPPDIRLIRDDP